jgi:hypothetical protein
MGYWHRSCRVVRIFVVLGKWWDAQHGNQEKDSQVKRVIKINQLLFRVEGSFFTRLGASSIRSNNLGGREDEDTEQPAERHNSDECGFYSSIQ